MLKNDSADVTLTNTRDITTSSAYKTLADRLKKKAGTLTEFSGYQLPEGRKVFYELLPKDVYQGSDGSISKEIYEVISPNTEKSYTITIPEAGEYYLDVITRCNASAEDFYITVSDNGEVVCDRLDIKRVSGRSDIRQDVCKKYFTAGNHTIKVKFTTNGSSGFTLSKISFEKTEDIVRDAGYDEGIIK